MERRKFLFTIPALSVLARAEVPKELIPLAPPTEPPVATILQHIGPGWHEAIVSRVIERRSKKGDQYFVVSHKLMDSPGEVALNLSPRAPGQAINFLRACGVDLSEDDMNEVDLESLVGSRIILRTKRETYNEIEYDRVVDCRRVAGIMSVDEI